MQSGCSHVCEDMRVESHDVFIDQREGTTVSMQMGVRIITVTTWEGLRTRLGTALADICIRIRFVSYYNGNVDCASIQK